MRPTPLLLLALILPACGGRVDLPADDAGTDPADTGSDVGATCAPADCGPAPGAPAPCPDGSLPADVCRRGSDGVCRWATTGCPTEKSCGATVDGACPVGQYCRFASCPAPGSTGSCTATPTACPKLYDPVCGCNGVTYANACAAALAFATVASTGACTTTRSCISNTECAKGEFCKMPDGLCGATPMPGGDPSPPEPTPPYPAGTCSKRPGGCPDLWEPVCGCNYVTYGNRCDAESAGVNVIHLGTCEGPPPVPTCGGFVGAECGPKEWCDYPTATCGGADEDGTCSPRPSACPSTWAPVCGCDGKTHANECVAHANGVDISASGACK